jgi:nicotinate phosphoribosyltransferase
MSSSFKNDALLTDLYQLTMLQSYLDHEMQETAVFELFVRRLPENRNFLVLAGLEQVLGYLESLQFSQNDISWLADTGRFNTRFLSELESFRFTGDVHAMPEGTAFFPQEPILRVTAPLPQAQIVESRLINIINFQTMVASKAARCRVAAGDKVLLDFGMRRAHGSEAAIMAARAAYVGGFDGTATVQAGQEFGIPLSGTMAHAFIQAHESESQAFLNFARSQPDNVVLLIDTYDPVRGAEKVVRVAEELKQEGINVKAVRLDSGSIADLAKTVRGILDEGGCGDTQIFASGDFDEFKIASTLESGSPVDGFGVGTRLVVSRDAPSLDSVYKLQEYAGTPRRKRSEGKATWPGRKQVYRYLDSDGHLDRDVMTLESETVEGGNPLIKMVMRNGQRLDASVPLESIRSYCGEQLGALTDSLRGIESPTSEFAVEMSDSIRALASDADSQYGCE